MAPPRPRCGRPVSHAVPEPPLSAVDGDGGQDDESVDDLLVGGARSVADEYGGQYGEEECPYAGARVVTRTSEDGPSDDHRYHALEQIRVTQRTIDRSGEADNHHADEGRADRAEREGDDPDAPGADQGVVGCSRVRACRQQTAAKP